MIDNLRNHLNQKWDDLIHPKRTLYFLHIPKSGGTSLVHFLRKNYLPDYWLNDGCYSLEHFYTIDDSEFTNNHCFRGHFGMVFFNRFDRQLNHFITILRDPVEQFCSNIHYQKKRFDLGLHEDWWKRNKWFDILSKPDYFNLLIDHKLSRRPFSPLLNNLGLMIPRDIDNAKDYRKAVKSLKSENWDIFLEQAKINVSKMTCILFLEDMDRSSQRLCKSLKIDPPSSFPTLNKGTHKSDNSTYRSQLTQDQLERIEEYLKHDYQLYYFAKQLVYGDNQIF